jgi:DNA-binding transcriptional regulator YdaS (Cro superfamily)
MKLHEPRKFKLHRLEKAALAEKCNVSPEYLRQVLTNPKKRPSPELAMRIERESGGVIRKEDLLPNFNWFLLEN